MSVTGYLAADPACFGSTDVTLAGWEDRAEGLGGVDEPSEPNWLTTNVPFWSFLRDRLGHECGTLCDGAISVHVDPASSLRFERDGHWVVITGHRNDPRAETCHFTGTLEPGMPTDEELRERCRAVFVLTSVRDAEPPAAALPSCPRDAVLRVAQFQDADPACFGSADVTLVGWEASPPAIGLMPPGIEPGWLWGLRMSALWGGEQIPGSEDCVDDAASCAWMFAYPEPQSGATFATNDRWVEIIGHLDDPAAEMCHYVYPPDWGTQPRNDDITARQTCRQSFVVTSLKVTTAPSVP
jgi:hypothetical protein